MSDITLNDAWQAGVDAVVADNTLNRGGFVDALQLVITDGLTNAEGNAYVDAVAVEMNSKVPSAVTQGTYNRLRANIIADPVLHMALFGALGTVTTIPEAEAVLESLSLTNARDERDEINNAIDRVDVLITAEQGQPPGTVRRLVIDILRDGKRALREYKERVRDEIQNITGDPDA